MGIPNIIKFLLVFNILFFAAGDPCPARCQCVKTAVRCLNQELTDIPKSPPTGTHTLDLRFNKIYEIIPGGFSHLHHLRSLLLNDNKLQAIRSGAFHGLLRLKYLYLYRNRISHIESDVFHGMEHLEQLYLHVNEIHQIEPETFSNLPRLERLYLHNNLLKRIPPGSFRGMPRLTKLRLDSNALICDCAMLWFVHMLAEHTEMKVVATCYGPEPMTGVSLASMKEHNLHCRHPEIAIGPEDVIVNFGEDAKFTCIATGEPAPEVVWLRDSAMLTVDKESHYEVMSNGTLMIHKADEKDMGIFECMARNPAGKVRSRPARMMLHSPVVESGRPMFSVLPRNQFAGLSQPFVSFDCVAQGNPRPHLAWLFNSEKILLNERVSLKHNGTIFIEDIQPKDAGQYTCQAENINGVITATAFLEVMLPPTFFIVPDDVDAVVGDTVAMQCSARGIPKPKLSWFKNRMPIPVSKNIAVSDDNKKLTIFEVNIDDAGTYHCRAENTEGLTEISATLNVEDISMVAPRIVTKPEDTDAFKGTSVALPCEVESQLPAEIQWRKDGTRVTPDDRMSISLIGSLLINNVTLRETGRYECSVSNKYGRDTASVFLTVKDHLLPGDEYVNIALTEATRDVDQAIARTVEQLFNNKSTPDIHDLFRIARFPNFAARNIARAAEIYERTLDKVKQFVESGLKVNITESFNYHHVLSAQHLQLIAQLSGCVAHREDMNCSDMCYHIKYRSIDGRCNNFAHPMWGASLTGFRRILYPIYENGFSHPVGWNKNIKYNGFILPSARLVSTEIISTNEITEDNKITHMVMQWGQWLDHDLDHALPPVSIQSWDGVDCKKTCVYAAPCFPIDVPVNDPRITNRRCIDFLRTSAVCGSGMTSVLFGTLQPREQINQLTSFIDASQVYGFEKTVAEDLRDLTNDNGLLRVGAVFPGRKPLLPTVGINGMDCRRNLEESNRNCFVAGDIRANEQVGLAAMHTIWMREHNRIASFLKSLNPFWDGDKVYQEARKIVGAEMQVITYDHWLPIVLGSNVHRDLGKYKGYNPDLNPSISNVFATAALRFGHTLINPVLQRFDENFDPIIEGNLSLRNAFFAPWRLVDEGGVDPLMRGMFITPAKLKTSTQNLNSELTEQLFYNAHAVALDLAAINIQRGRDHALPPYTKWREYCKMSDVNTFDDLANEISNPEVRERLKELYGSVHNIDVFVGGILEDQVEGGKVGPLFRCLLLEQFGRLRDGDRFWYENLAIFKADQLRQLKRTSLARVLCDNGDNIDTIGENVFLLPEVQDGLISCEDLPSMDLRYWADCASCDGNDNERPARVRRSADYENVNFEEDNRFNNLEDSHNDLEKTVDMLRKRIEYLEENCHSGYEDF